MTRLPLRITYRDYLLQPYQQSAGFKVEVASASLPSKSVFTSTFAQLADAVAMAKRMVEDKTLDHKR